MVHSIKQVKKKILILHKPFQKIQQGGTLPNSLYEANITLIPKSDKHTIRKENYSSIYMNIDTKINKRYKIKSNI